MLNGYQLERIKRAFNVFEDKDMVVLHGYDVGQETLAPDTMAKIKAQLDEYGIVYKSIVKDEVEQSITIYRIKPEGE